MTISVAVLVSGQGSNLKALVQAIDEGRCDARVVTVIADRPCPALDFAASRGIATGTCIFKDHPSREAWDAALAQSVAASEPSLVVLAGFMRIIGPAMLERFPWRVINVHPALLPSFPGTHAAAQALAKGVLITGCTVHLVDAGVDTGPILAQAAVPVLAGDDAAALQRRIQTQEHQLLPAVVDAVGRGDLLLGARPQHRRGLSDGALQVPNWAT